jgi:hypothetical protein
MAPEEDSDVQNPCPHTQARFHYFPANAQARISCPGKPFPEEHDVRFDSRSDHDCRVNRPLQTKCDVSRASDARYHSCVCGPTAI